MYANQFNNVLKMNRRCCNIIAKVWTWIIIVSLVVCQLNVTECSVQCEFLYGGCKHAGDSFYPPVLSLKHHPEAAPKYNQQVYVPSPPGKQPRCAKPGLTFCEKIDKYPMDLIRTLVAKTNYNFKSLFADESSGVKRDHKFAQGDNFPGSASGILFNQSSQRAVGYPDRQYPLDESSIHIVDPVLYASFDNIPVHMNSYNPDDWWKRSERAGTKTGHKRKRRQSPPSSTPAGTELCPTRSQFIMPRAALNSRGEWKYVVNVEQGNEKYTQLVRSEICLTRECNGICSLPNGYVSHCEQKYVQKRLVALEGTGSSLYTDVFWFPHCCVCQIAPDIR